MENKLIVDPENKLVIVECVCGNVHTIKSNEKQELEITTKEKDNDETTEEPTEEGGSFTEKFFGVKFK